MGRATALPESADSHTLAQQIALHLNHGPAFILVTGNNAGACRPFLDDLSSLLSSAHQVLRLHAPDASASLFDQVANVLGLGIANTSAASLAKHLDEGNTLLLCSMENKHCSDGFEQLRQLSNLQPNNGHLSIVLCGDSALAGQLPDALRQRITTAFSLGRASGVLRFTAGIILLSALSGIAWLVHEKFHVLPIPLNIKEAPLASKPLFETSLKAGPVLAQPLPVEVQNPLTHVFQTEAEAEAAMRAQTPAEKPDPE